VLALNCILPLIFPVFLLAYFLAYHVHLVALLEAKVNVRLCSGPELRQMLRKSLQEVHAVLVYSIWRKKFCFSYDFLAGYFHGAFSSCYESRKSWKHLKMMCCMSMPSLHSLLTLSTQKATSPLIIHAGTALIWFVSICSKHSNFGGHCTPGNCACADGLEGCIFNFL